ncbi:MAG: sensor histidine kinase [Gammaproteobacteria bacterium]|nr:MAG: sensor histidine kinase [Gammaproteobacteria bacterium]
MRSSSLQRRIILAFSLFGGVLGVSLVGASYYLTLQFREEIISQKLFAELDSVVLYYTIYHRLPAPRSAESRIYLSAGKNTFGLPAHLNKLTPGFHSVAVAGQKHHVAVKDMEGARFYLSQPDSALQLNQSYLLFLTLTLIISLLAALAIGAAVSNRVTRPLIRLTRKIADAGGENSKTRLAGGLDNDEIGALAAALDLHVERTKALIAREREFGDDASHELRTPLAVLKGTVELLLLEPDLPDSARKRLQRIEHALHEISDVIAGLLLLSRAPNTTESTTLYPVEPVLHEVVENNRYLISGKPIELSMELDGTTQVSVAPSTLRIVLGNLIRNAFNYTIHGRILLKLDKGSLTIEDTGIGIQQSDMGRLFERYYRGAEASKAAAGMGLGLSLVQRVCERYGWRIEIISHAGSGTRVRLLFKEASPV